MDKLDEEEELLQLSGDWVSERNTLNKTQKSKNSGKSDRAPHSPISQSSKGKLPVVNKIATTPRQQPNQTKASPPNFGMLAKRISDFKSNIRKFQSQNLLLEIDEEEDESENEELKSGRS